MHRQGFIQGADCHQPLIHSMSDGKFPPNSLHFELAAPFTDTLLPCCIAVIVSLLLGLNWVQMDRCAGSTEAGAGEAEGDIVDWTAT